VQSFGQSEVCHELGLSQSSFYRRLQEAVEAVVSILWEKYQRNHAAEGKGQAVVGAEPSPAQRALEEAIELAYVAPRRPVNLSESLESARSTIAPFAREQGITLQIDMLPALPTAYGDPAVLDQILLNVLTEGMRLAAGKDLTLVVRVRDGDTVWELRGLAESQGSPYQVECFDGLIIAQGLLRAYGGQLHFDQDERGSPILCFTLPVAKLRSILIVDDDPDAVALYRHYLSGHEYILHAARDAEQVQGLITESKPELVLLDVLMPQRDGWKVLQRLKATPETASIPVIVCSVLSQPGLALALGAAQVLQKPISQEALVRAVEEALGQEDSVC
jgi:CheY-like chemotaxis protein